jgi:hypothetical protein
MAAPPGLRNRLNAKLAAAIGLAIEVKLLRERKALFEPIFFLKINREKVCAGERTAHLKDRSGGFMRTHREAGCEEIEPLFKGLRVGSS